MSYVDCGIYGSDECGMLVMYYMQYCMSVSAVVSACMFCIEEVYRSL